MEVFNIAPIGLRNMENLPRIIGVLLSVAFVTACTTGKQITNEATINHSWSQQEPIQKNVTLEHTDASAGNHIESRPGYHTYIDGWNSQTYRILYFADLNWSGTNVTIPNNPNQNLKRWLTQAADIELTSKSFRFDEEVQDWVDGPPVQLDFESCSNSSGYLRISAECLFYVDADKSMFPKSYKGRTVRLPIEFTIFDEKKSL